MNYLVDGLGILTVLSAFFIVFTRNVIYGVLLLLSNLIFIGLIYLVSGAYFIAFIQFIVYGGGVVILFLYAIMNLKWRGGKLYTSPMGFLGLLAVVSFFVATLIATVPAIGTRNTSTVDGSPLLIGKLLLGRYLLPYEIVSVLLTVGFVSAFIMARKR